jgi:hypothetical protein
MATKTFYATKDLKNPSYGTRMLKAGDPVELDAPKARLYLALGAVSPMKPRAARAAAEPAPPVETPSATAKPAPRKRIAKKRATAKK